MSRTMCPRYLGDTRSRFKRQLHIVKLLWWDGDGLCLLAKRLERGRFIWPKAESGTVDSVARSSMLLEGIDWRRVERTWTPEVAV
jgi:transposase